MGIKVKKTKKVVSVKERELRRKEAQARETLLMYKFLFAAIAMIAGIMAVMTIRRNGAVTVGFLLNVQLPLTIVLGVLTIAAIVYHIMKRNSDESMRVITSTSLVAVSFAAFCLCASYGYIDVLYDTWRIVAIIALAVLYFVYHIYDTVFFVVSAQCATGLFAVNLLSKASLPDALRIVVGIFAIAACVIGAYLLLKAMNNTSLIKDYKLVIMSAIIIAGVLLSLFIPMITSYAIFALLAVYVIIAVICTIELM